MSKKKSKLGRPRKPIVVASIRRHKLAKILVENRGSNKSIGSAMLEAGYSPATAHNSQQIVKTKSFQALLDEAMPEDFTISKHKSLLEAEVKTYRKGELETVRQDTDSIARGLDMLYKLKGKYAPEKSIVLNLYQGKEDREILEEIDRLEQELGIKRGHD